MEACQVYIRTASLNTQLRRSFVTTSPIFGAKHCYAWLHGSTTGVISNGGKQVIVPQLTYEPTDKPGNCMEGSPAGEDYMHMHKEYKVGG